MMKNYFCIIIIIKAVLLVAANAEYCGCKYMRPCYKKMLDDLLLDDEDPCIENVEIGSSTITVFLTALRKYCRWHIQFNDEQTTFEGRNLYEVIVHSTLPENKEIHELPVIVLDAGQDGGVGPVSFALFVIEQLVACSENREMLKNVRWVILPSTNPDGLEFAKPNEERWYKNFNPLINMTSTQTHLVQQIIGVDITRNFDDSWDECPRIDNVFSPHYPGPRATSEKETMFIVDVLKKYKNIKTYISLRRDGHAILFPFASKNYTFESIEKVKKRAGDVAAKVNQRAGGIHWFINESIFNMNGKAQCGHSVDYAINKVKLPYVFEMRVFAESDNEIMSMFQTVPKGSEVTLRMGYFSGIREIYKAIVNENKRKPKK